jgi:hypothetical protein
MARQCKICGALVIAAIMAASSSSPVLCENCTSHREPEIEKETYNYGFLIPTATPGYISNTIRKFKKQIKNYKFKDRKEI